MERIRVKIHSLRSTNASQAYRQEGVEQSLMSMQQEYAAYINHVNELFALFADGNISEAEQAANQTEKHEQDFNRRLESLLFESETNSQRFLSSVEEREGKAIILIAMIISIALLLTIVALFLNYITSSSRKVRASRGRSRKNGP